MEFSRVDRLQSQMVRDLAAIVAEDLKDAPPHMITFTRAELTRDLTQARIYFSVLGDEKAIERCDVFLRRHAGVIRKLLGRRLRVRHNPEILFKYDDSAAGVLRIGELLDEIKKEDDTSSDK